MPKYTTPRFVSIRFHLQKQGSIKHVVWQLHDEFVYVSRDFLST